MPNKDMIYGGFDPTFIDIDIQPIDSKTDELVTKLPKIGSHHTPTDINFRPGGNGFNLCRTLATLGRPVTYVGPSSQLFETLILENNIPIQIRAIENSEVNFTGILNLLDGEIQFNSVRGKLSVDSLSEELVKLYRQSPLKSISNVSLNPSSIEWISSLALTLWSGDVFELLKEGVSPLNLLQNSCETSFEGVMFIDPSDITHFKQKEEFKLFLLELKKLDGEKYLSVNENELKSLTEIFSNSPQQLFDLLELPIIYHSAEEVIFYGKENIKLTTKQLETQKTFVGAGDCFNGSFLHSIFENNSIEDSLEYAIKAASYLIETGNYPSALHISKRINT